MLPNLKVEIIEPVLVKGKPEKKDFEALDTLANSVFEAHKKAGLL